MSKVLRPLLLSFVGSTVLLLFAAVELMADSTTSAEMQVEFDPLLSAAEKPLCGIYCLYVALVALDVPVESLQAVEARLGPPPRRGYSMGQLSAAAKSFGVESLGVKAELDRLTWRGGRFACIAHIQNRHFVNIVDVAENSVLYCDAPGMQTVPRITFESLWDGQALLLSTSDLTAEEELVEPGQLMWNWWTWILAVAGALAIVTGAWQFVRRYIRSGTERSLRV